MAQAERVTSAMAVAQADLEPGDRIVWGAGRSGTVHSNVDGSLVIYDDGWPASFNAVETPPFMFRPAIKLDGLRLIERVDIGALASGIMHGMVMTALETAFETLSEFPMPPQHESTENFGPVPHFYSFHLRVANLSLDHRSVFCTVERRMSRNLSPHQRYELLERIAELAMAEANKAKKEASE